MTQLTPYLRFSGNCREALTFYQTIFGGELELMRAGDSPMADQLPTGSEDGVLHGALHGGKVHLYASDMFNAEAEQQQSVALCITGTKDELRETFDKLAEGARKTEPLSEMFFGMFGSLTDKFGFDWMFSSDDTPAA